MSKTYEARIYRRVDGKWGFRVKSANGKTLVGAQGYTRKWSAKRAAKALANVDVVYAEFDKPKA